MIWIHVNAYIELSLWITITSSIVLLLMQEEKKQQTVYYLPASSMYSIYGVSFIMMMLFLNNVHPFKNQLDSRHTRLTNIDWVSMRSSWAAFEQAVVLVTSTHETHFSWFTDVKSIPMWMCVCVLCVYFIRLAHMHARSMYTQFWPLPLV